MKFVVLQLAALATAFVIPDEQVLNLEHVEIEANNAWDSVRQHIPSKSDLLEGVEDKFEQVSKQVDGKLHNILEDVQSKYRHYSHNSKQVLDDVKSSLEDVESDLEHEIDQVQSAVHQWKSTAEDKLEDLQDVDLSSFSPLGHHHHHHKPNQTIYQVISESKYTKKLAKLINEFDDLVEVLNGTAANYTFFAPTDCAFEHLPHHKISKKDIEKALKYHVSYEPYPFGRILTARTIPTLLRSSSLGKNKPPQRLTTDINHRGVTINYFTRFVGIDKFATNGVVHLLDSFIIPPPPVSTIIDLAPAYFSTLQLGLVKTGLFDVINTTDPQGGTLFAPSNSAFEKLSPELAGFLFSKYGLKYLEAILRYHIVPKNTLYSDAFYKESASEAYNIPKGRYHVDLETLLDDRSLSIDIARYGRLFAISINAYDIVSASDIVGKDGVIQVVSSVLIPPKKLKGGEAEETQDINEMTVDELKERLDPYLVEDDSHWEEL